MKYLDIIQLLNHGLKTLNSGTRVQVPVSKLDEIMTVILRSSDKLGEERTLGFNTSMEDVLSAISVIQDTSNLSNLTENMKQSLISGIESMKLEVCNKAYAYYELIDFEPTEEIIPIMRDVVETYAEGGGHI